MTLPHCEVCPKPAYRAGKCVTHYCETVGKVLANTTFTADVAPEAPASPSPIRADLRAGSQGRGLPRTVRP